METAIGSLIEEGRGCLVVEEEVMLLYASYEVMTLLPLISM